MGGFNIKNLRKLRLKAGLTQRELAEQAGLSASAICLIEQDKTTPRILTRSKLLRILSLPTQDRSGEPEETSGIFLGEILNREEFFARLKPKMNRSLGGFFDEALIPALVDSIEFFTRQRYYPADFSTAVRILGALMRAQRRLLLPDLKDDEENGLKRKQPPTPGGYFKNRKMARRNMEETCRYL